MVNFAAMKKIRRTNGTCDKSFFIKRCFCIILFSFLISTTVFAQNEKIPIDGYIFSYTKDDSNKNIEITPRISPENCFKISDVKIDGIFEQIYGYPKITNLKRTDKNTFDEVGIVSRPDSKKNISAYSDILKVSFKITAIKNIKLKNLFFKYASQSDYNSTKVEIKINNGKIQKLSGSEGVVINANYNLTKYTLKPQDTAEITIHGFYTVDMTNKNCNTVINNLYITAEADDSIADTGSNQTENSSKCMVTSDALKKPIEFSTISEFEKNIKAIAKAAAKATVEIEIPAESEIRKDIYDSLLYNKKLQNEYILRCDEYVEDSYSYSERKENSWPNHKDKYYTQWYNDCIINGTTPIIMTVKMESSRAWRWKFLQIASYKDYEKFEKQRNENEKNGYGRFTNAELKSQSEKNKAAGLGEIPDVFVEKQRNKNEANGLGRFTDAELTRKRIQLLKNEKKWCYLLGLYYDEFLKAQIADNSQKVDFLGYESPKHTSKKSGNSDNYNAYYNAYKELRDLILSGKPGFGEYNDFQLYNEWKNLLIDAEKYGTEYGALYIGLSCERVKLNYENSTADYEVVVGHDFSNRYKYTIDIIRRGYMKAYKEDWNDLPSVAKYPDSSYMKSGYEAGYKSLNSYYNDCAWPLESVGGKTNIPGILTYKQGKWIPSESQRDGNFYRYTHDFDFKNGNAKPINRDFKFVNYSSKYKSIENAFAVDRAGGYYSEDGSAFCMNNTLYEVKINFIDKDGTEVIKPQSCLIANVFDSSEWRLMPSLEPQTKISLNGVPEEIVTKIDSKEVFPNICEVNLYYGEFNPDMNKGKTGFIKALNKKTLPLDKIEKSATMIVKK